MTYIVHGEPPAAKALAEVIRQKLKSKTEVAKHQQKVIALSPFRLQIPGEERTPRD